MQLPENLLDVNKHEIHLRTLLSDPACFVILDTNTLIWPYRLGRSARDTFVSWLSELATNNRLVIPSWVAFEFHRHSTAGNQSVFRPFADVANKFLETAQQLQKFAPLLADDMGVKSFGYSSGQDFLKKFSLTLSEATKIAHHIKKMNDDRKDADAQIRNLLASNALNSNIHQLLRRCEKEAPLRQLHGLGPGTKDLAKPENSYGDLIIWFEILQHSQANNGRSYLIVTNDVKTDWNYPPPKIRNIQGREENNRHKNSYYVLRPDLRHEFATVTNNTEIQIIDTVWLCALLCQMDGAKYKTLAFAIQSLDEPPPPSSPPSTPPSTPPSSPPSTPPSPPSTPPSSPLEETSRPPVEVRKPEALSPSVDALADKNFAVSRTQLGELIEMLRTHSWASQNRAVALFEASASRTGENDEFFVFGRNLYQAACGNSHRAMDFLSRLPDSIANVTNNDDANYLAAGMMYEIYFGGWNNLRDVPKTDMLDSVANLYKERHRYRRAFEYIARRIAEAAESKPVPFLASFDFPEPKVALELELEAEKSAHPRIQCVKHGSRCLLLSSQSEVNLRGHEETAFDPDEFVDADEIARAVSTAFYTPRRFIKLDSKGHKSFQLNFYTYVIRFTEPPAASLLVDVPSLAGKDRSTVETKMGPSLREESVSPARVGACSKLYFKGEDVEIVFISEKADWITVSNLGSIPYDPSSLSHFGFAPATPAFQNEHGIRWKNIQGFLEVVLFPGRPGYCSYLYAKYVTP